MRISPMRAVLLGSTVLTGSTGVFGAQVELLATWEVPPPGVIHGSQEIFDSRWPAFVYLLKGNEFRAPLFEDFVLDGPFPVDIENTVTAENEPDYSEFVGMLTDGINQEVVVVQWSYEGMGSGGGGAELFDLQFLVPRFGPDLIGYVVDHITQTLTVDIESPGSDPFGDGIWTDWSVIGRYKFYGSPVPEPATLALLAVGAWMIRTHRKSEKRL